MGKSLFIKLKGDKVILCRYNLSTDFKNIRIKIADKNNTNTILTKLENIEKYINDVEELARFNYMVLKSEDRVSTFMTEIDTFDFINILNPLIENKDIIESNLNKITYMGILSLICIPDLNKSSKEDRMKIFELLFEKYFNKSLLDYINKDLNKYMTELSLNNMTTLMRIIYCSKTKNNKANFNNTISSFKSSKRKKKKKKTNVYLDCDFTTINPKYSKVKVGLINNPNINTEINQFQSRIDLLITSGLIKKINLLIMRFERWKDNSKDLVKTFFMLYYQCEIDKELESIIRNKIDSNNKYEINSHKISFIYSISLLCFNELNDDNIRDRRTILISLPSIYLKMDCNELIKSIDENIDLKLSLDIVTQWVTKLDLGMNSNEYLRFIINNKKERGN